MSGMDFGMMGGNDATLVLNANNTLVKYIFDNEKGDNVDLMCKQLYDLAKIANAPLEPNEMTEFVARSNKIMELLAEV
jgi:molecular chaperone HtpG